MEQQRMSEKGMMKTGRKEKGRMGGDRNNMRDRKEKEAASELKRTGKPERGLKRQEERTTERKRKGE